jgi:MoaA/NifB/PqqE/SkfB family radical SAM enzyme
MREEDLRALHAFTYRDLVAQSIQHLETVRRGYRLAEAGSRVPPEFPTHVQIQTLGGCNASCGMCPMSVPRYRGMQRGRMPDALFAKIVDECARHPECKVISPYLQNEPLLDRTLEDKVALVKARSGGRLAARIVTNGSLLTPKRSAALLEAGIDVISISVNAHSRAVYERVMPGLDFETVRANVDALLALGPPRTLVLLTFMVTRDNEHEIPEAIEYWSAHGVMCGAFGLGTMAGTVENFDGLLALGTPSRRKECFVPLEATAILANGDMLLCCTDWARSTVYGNVTRDDLESVWHSPALSRARRNAIGGCFDEAACEKCLGQTKTLDNLMYAGGPGLGRSPR